MNPTERDRVRGGTRRRDEALPGNVGVLYTAQLPLKADGSFETGDVGAQTDRTPPTFFI
jgi:hypothetical protein